MENHSNNKRIAKNTLFLYFRMFIKMGVSLYTSRIVLNVLGIQDYGIYNVVGGVVAMVAIINVSLASASQRFLTFELGRKNFDKLSQIFSTTVTIHIIIAIIVFFLAETLGLWFINRQMNIDISRMRTVNWVYQCSVISFVLFIIKVPYNAAIIAHEHMKTFAYVGIVEVLLKLLIVFLLPLFNFDKLKFYSILILFVIIIITLIYIIYCKLHFSECTYSFTWNKLLVKEIASFAGWNFIGSSSFVLMNQGVNILLNLFYGVNVNAAQGISSQVQNAVGGFVNNFMTALNPQITKSYASNEKNYMFSLINQGSKFSYFLIFFLSLPFLIETNIILKVWLKIVPFYAVIFVKLSLIFTISQTLSNTLVTALTATGDIKKYQIIVGSLLLLNLPLSYFALKIGFVPQITYIISISISFFALFARLWMAKSMINLSIWNYIKDVILNVLLVTFISVLFPLLLHFYMQEGIKRLLVVTIVCFIATSFSIYYFGLASTEKQIIKFKLKQIRKQLFYKVS